METMSDKLVSLESVLKETRRFKGYIDDDMIERFSIAFKRLPHIPQEMTAAEYLKQKYRMDDWSAENCNRIADVCDVECNDCPYDQVPSCTDEAKRPLEAVAIVEKWAREHPEERSEDE